MTTPESLIKAHNGFLGQAPSARQMRIYESFPSHRGVSSTELDSELFTAALIIALVQTYPLGRPDPVKAYLFVRGAALAWASKELATVARRMFDYLKAEQKIPRAKHLGTFFHAVSMGSRVLSFKDEPERWVAFGFDRDDPTIPEWLRASLLLESAP